MCLIIDANRASIVFSNPPHPDFAPVIDWLQKKDGCLIIGGQLGTELDRLREARRFVRALLQAGRAKRVPDTQMIQEEAVVSKTSLCRSNDSHVVALARVSGARTLCSEDQDLWDDFRNLRLIRPKGSIYRRKEHARLLRHTRSCRWQSSRPK